MISFFFDRQNFTELTRLELILATSKKWCFALVKLQLIIFFYRFTLFSNLFSYLFSFLFSYFFHLSLLAFLAFKLSCLISPISPLSFFFNLLFQLFLFNFFFLHSLLPYFLTSSLSSSIFYLFIEKVEEVDFKLFLLIFLLNLLSNFSLIPSLPCLSPLSFLAALLIF